MSDQSGSASDKVEQAIALLSSISGGGGGSASSTTGSFSRVEGNLHSLL